MKIEEQRDRVAKIFGARSSTSSMTEFDPPVAASALRHQTRESLDC
jgi:hypothetical protein